MKKVAIGLYGAGGFGREVAALLPTIIPKLFPTLSVQDVLIVFIDDNVNLNKIDGKKVLSKTDFLKLSDCELYYNVTISDCWIRKSVVEFMEKSNVKPLTFIFNETLTLDNSNFGNGTIVMPGSIISTSVIIRDHVHINFNSYIAHDCIINNFVTISPGVICCGNTVIGENAFVGAGAVIKQGTYENPRIIGEHSTLGLGSILIDNVPNSQIFIGNPAKKIIK